MYELLNGLTSIEKGVLHMNKILFLILSVPTVAMASWGVGGSMHSLSDVDSGFGDLEFSIDLAEWSL